MSAYELTKRRVPFRKGPEVQLEPHPRSCDLDGVEAIARATKRPLAVDIFCGAGGLSYGLHLAGFEVVLAVDKDPEAANTHRAHFPGASLNADLSDKSVLESITCALRGVQIDLIAGGPPCQPYSQAAFSKVRDLQENHGKADDPRRELWASFMHLVREIIPRAVLIENVPEVAFGRDGIVLRRLVRDLEDAGYIVHSKVLSSEAYGVPQHRQRLFIVALRQNLPFSWPKRDETVQRKLRDAIEDLPPVEGGDKQEVRAYSSNPSPLQKYFRDSLPPDARGLIYDHHTRAVREDDLEAFKLMTSKTTYRQLPAHLKRYRDDIFEDKYKRLDMDQLSRTITAHISRDGYWYIHPTQHRTLTIREAARIQTFPDSFRFCGYPNHAFRQIGEAVPPLLGHAVGAAVLAALEASNLEDVSLIRTREVSRTLDSWYRKQELTDLRRPWLATNDSWTRILGHLLFDRASPSQIMRSYNATICRWPSPERLLADKEASDYAEGLFKFEYYESLQTLAVELVDGSNISAELLTKCHVPKAMVLSLLAVTGAGSRRPVNTALERFVRRFTGVEPSSEDGRGNAEMLLGRIVGCDEDGIAYCAANEVAARYCLPSEPLCLECPLRGLCAKFKGVLGTVDRLEVIPELAVASA